MAVPAVLMQLPFLISQLPLVGSSWSCRAGRHLDLYLFDCRWSSLGLYALGMSGLKAVSGLD